MSRNNGQKKIYLNSEIGQYFRRANNNNIQQNNQQQAQRQLIAVAPNRYDYGDNQVNVSNELYQYNNNYRKFKNKFPIPSLDYQRRLEKKILSKMFAPFPIRYQTSLATSENSNMFIFLTDPYFDLKDWKSFNQSGTALQALNQFDLMYFHNEMGVVGQSIYTAPVPAPDAMPLTDIYLPTTTNYKELITQYVPEETVTTFFENLKIPESILNFSFQPKDIILNPNIAAVNWGWIFKFNPSMIRFDMNLMPHFNYIFNLYHPYIYLRGLHVLNEQVTNLTVGETMTLLGSNRIWRIIAAEAYCNFVTTTVTDDLGANSVPNVFFVMQNLVDSQIFKDEANKITGFTPFLSKVMTKFGAYYRQLIDVGELQSNIQNLFNVGNVDNVNVFATRLVRTLQQMSALLPNNQIRNNEIDKFWRALLSYNKQAKYLLYILFDAMFWYRSTTAGATHTQLTNTQFFCKYLQNSNLVTGLGAPGGGDSQFYFVLAEMLSEKLIKVYPCNMMVGRHWEISKKRTNSLSFFIPNKLSNQTINIEYNIAVLNNSFKRWIVESTDYRKYFTASETIKAYLAKHIKNIENFLRLKTFNRNYINSRIDRKLNLLALKPN